MADAYLIRITGHLDSSWTDWFAGFTLIHEADGTTLLKGSVVDQPALHSLLTRINALGLTLILVEQVENDVDLDRFNIEA